MARTKLISVFLICIGFGLNAFAASGGNINRGGLGFLFPDHNSFANPGQFSDSHATALEAFYSRTTATGTSQTLTPSIVYGNGSVGFGAYGSRSGTNLLGTGNADSAGAGLGLSLMKGRATLGVSYDKSLAGSGSGVAGATFTLNPAGKKGVAIGAGYKRDLTAGTNELTAGLGYSFMGNSNLEVDVTFPSISALGTFNLAAYFTTAKNMIYLGGGYLMSKTPTTTQSGAEGRLGFILGHSVDASFWTQYYFVTGSTLSYGGSLRAAF